MGYCKTEAPVTVCIALESTDTETDATRQRETRRDNSSTCDYAHPDYTAAMRRQQGCYAYWTHVYGADAELASRGGVAWVL